MAAIDPASKGGFTFIEALITLLISSLVLTSVFSLAQRMTQDAGKLEGRLKNVVQLASVETELRLLAAAFVVAPEQALPSTIEESAFSGTERMINGTISTARPIPCAPQGGTFPIQLRIEDDPNGGSRLVCNANGKANIVRTFRDGEVRFRYLDRENGIVVDRWPVTLPLSTNPFAQSATAPRAEFLNGLPPSIILEWREGQNLRTVIAATVPSGPARPTNNEFDRPDDIL